MFRLLNHHCSAICYSLLAAVFYSISLSDALAGGVAGAITGANGEALPFAAIFVKETGAGAVANEDGYYEIRLEPGRYTLAFQHLGYETLVREVTVHSGPFTRLDVALKVQTIQLRTVEVSSRQEDPAYTVMRRAIAKASWHRQQVESYSAQVYIKGSGRLKKAPFFLRRELKKEGIDSSFAFVSESVSRIQYQRPSTFKETVISIRKQGDDNQTSPAPFINGSFYEPQIADVVSPLAPRAFAYYKFKHAGYFMDRGYGVNKIQVIPRSQGDNVLEGYIYILEDLWSIYSLDLKTYKQGFGISVRQTYAPIEDKAWLPIKHQFDVDGTFLGFHFEYSYVASVSDYQIKLNPSLDVPITVVDEKLNPQAAKDLPSAARKTAVTEKRLAAGQEVTMKDLRQMVREYEKEDRKERIRQDTVYIPGITEVKEYRIDSMAYRRDSAYWAEIRPIPLTLYEVRGYQRVDSISAAEAAKADSLQADEDGVSQKNGASFRPLSILFGGNYKLGKHTRFSFNSALANLNFNPVEGFHSWMDIRFNTHWKRIHQLRLEFTPRYAAAPNRFSAKGMASYRFGRQLHRATTLHLEGGRYIFQLNPQRPISEFFNTVSCLLHERNYIRLYEKDYITASAQQKLAENIELRAGIEWADRLIPDNRTTQTWFNDRNRGYASNIPLNEEWLGIQTGERAFIVQAAVETRPWQKYRIRNGIKSPIENSSPTLQLLWRKGIPGIQGSITDFDLLDFLLKHSFKVGAAGYMDIKLEAGKFLNNRYAGFADYRHFMGNLIPVVTADPVGSFRLLDYYRHSTQEEYVALHVHHRFRQLLLTRITPVWLMGLRESLFVNYLATPTSQHYTELGYSIDNILRVFRVEAVAAFQNGKYYDWGIRVGIAANWLSLSFN